MESWIRVETWFGSAECFRPGLYINRIPLLYKGCHSIVQKMMILEPSTSNASQCVSKHSTHDTLIIVSLLAFDDVLLSFIMASNYQFPDMCFFLTFPWVFRVQFRRLEIFPVSPSPDNEAFPPPFPILYLTWLPVKFSFFETETPS